MDEHEVISEPLPWRHVWVQQAGGAYRTHESWLDIGGGGPVMPAEAGTPLHSGFRRQLDRGRESWANYGVNLEPDYPVTQDDIAGAGREVEGRLGPERPQNGREAHD